MIGEFKFKSPKDHYKIIATIQGPDGQQIYLIERAEYEKLKAKLDQFKSVLEAVRSQMCWERDRDQLTMGFAELHDDVTKVLKDE